MAGKPKPIESSVFLSEVRASGFSEVWTHSHDLNKFQQVNIRIKYSFFLFLNHKTLQTCLTSVLVWLALYYKRRLLLKQHSRRKLE